MTPAIVPGKNAVQKIIVIGASAGGFEAIKKMVAGLPPDFKPPIFIVWHMAANVQGVLPQVLNKKNSILTSHAYDGELILPNRIYIAPPDYHMVIGEGNIKITRGPKENHFRPAVDPLFRSAAHSYRNRVIGIILSGALDDGTAGLATIKKYGGTAIVQDPLDAEISGMPSSALREVNVDYCVPVSRLARLLVHLSTEPVSPTVEISKEEEERTKIEIAIASEKNALKSGVMGLGELSPFTCPECNGVLMRLTDGNLVRFRCHTGHAFSADALLRSLTENIEESLYSAIRGIEESIMLLNHIGDHFAESNQPKVAGVYFNKAKEAEKRAEIVRQAALQHEELSDEKIRQNLKPPDQNLIDYSISEK